MGFFAGELEVVLQEHNPLPNESPWNVLNRLNVHHQQTERLQKAAEDIGQISTLPPPLLLQLKHELNLSPIAWARLQAGVEADAFFRLLMYHNYSLEEAVNKANAVFASALKDKVATGGKSDSIYPSLPELDALAAIPSPVRRRGRMRKVDKEAMLSQKRELKSDAKNTIVAQPKKVVVPRRRIQRARHRVASVGYHGLDQRRRGKRSNG